jgi:hypothetical protein
MAQEPHQRPTRPSPREIRSKQLRFNFIFLFIALLLLILVNVLGREAIRPETVSYSRFLQAMDEEAVMEVAISPNEVVWDEAGPTPEAPLRSFRATRVPGVDDRELVERLHAMDAELKGEVPSEWWPGVLLWVIPMVFIIGIWIWVIRRMAGGRTQALTFGSSRARIWDESTNRITFEDVAGVDEAVAELREVVDFLKNPPDTWRWELGFPREFSWWVLLERERRSWLEPRPGRLASPSSPSPEPTSWRCSWEWAPPGSGTSSGKPGRRHRALSSSMRSTPWARPEPGPGHR